MTPRVILGWPLLALFIWAIFRTETGKILLIMLWLAVLFVYVSVALGTNQWNWWK